jgi:hypothetical protein
MGMTYRYDMATPRDDGTSIAVIHQALDLGVTAAFVVAGLLISLLLYRRGVPRPEPDGAAVIYRYDSRPPSRTAHVTGSNRRPPTDSCSRTESSTPVIRRRRR